KARQERLDAKEVDALVEIVEQPAQRQARHARLVGALGEGAARARETLLGEELLTRWAEVGLLQRPHRALVVRTKEPDRLDRVAVQLDAQRIAVEGRENVEDEAAHREGAGVLDDRHARVAGGDEASDHLLAVAGVAGEEEIGAAGQGLAGDD